MKAYANPMQENLPVYADSKMTLKIGILFKGSACQCIGTQGDTAIILYKVSNSGNFKVGFADPCGIQQR